MKTKKQIEAEGFEITFTNGTGAGGQKRNRTYSVAVVKHIESGISKRNDQTRNANKNMILAYEEIVSKLDNEKQTEYHNKINDIRKQALSKGTIRTYDYKRSIVKNHLNGKEASLKKVMEGDLNIIW